MVSKYYPLFNAYTSGLQIEQYYTLKNDSIVSTYSEGISYKDEVIDFFKEHGFVEIQKETRKNSGENYEMTRKEVDDAMLKIALANCGDNPGRRRLCYSYYFWVRLAGWYWWNWGTGA